MKPKVYDEWQRGWTVAKTDLYCLCPTCGVKPLTSGKEIKEGERVYFTGRAGEIIKAEHEGAPYLRLVN